MKTSESALQGSAQLILDMAGGTVSIVERMHSRISFTVNPANWFFDSTAGISMFSGSRTYQTLRNAKSLLDSALKTVFGEINTQQVSSLSLDSPGKAHAVINGLCGDHLHNSQNPLAVEMHLHDGQYHLSLDREALLKQQDAAGTELVIMVHGWCHNYLNWQGETGMDLAKALTKSGQFTPIYLNYNSGRHISQNGQLLNELLNKLVACWPSPIKSLNLIGHSMGGLVIRSASRYAEFSDSPWLDRICKVIYLGSPHHGAPLAKAGHLATFLMRKTHYAEPLAFGQYLSDGVKDLRHGNLLDEDWQNVNQDDLVPDQRAPVPLTPHAEHYFLAAAIGEDETNLGSLAFGDLLVRLGSATGSHREQLKSLDIAADQCRILAGMDHFDLLKNPAVQQQIVDWLST